MRRTATYTFVVAAFGLLASAAKAQPHVNLWLNVVNATPTGGSWQVYADVSQDNDGLASYIIDVLGSGGAAVTGSVGVGIINKAPRLTDFGDINNPDLPPEYNDGIGGLMGFNSFSNSNGTVSGGNRIGITRAQTTVYFGADDPTIDMGVFVGVGQEPSSASPQNGTQGPIDGSGYPVVHSNNPVWTYQSPANLPAGNGQTYHVAGTLVEQGTYSNLTNSFAAALTAQVNPSGSITVLATGGGIPPDGLNFPGFYNSGDNQLWGKDPYQAGEITDATVSDSTINVYYVPEPAPISLIALMSVGFLGASRRFRPRRSSLAWL